MSLTHLPSLHEADPELYKVRYMVCLQPQHSRQRQEDQELKAILGYTVKFKTSLSTCNLSKTKQNENVRGETTLGRDGKHVTSMPPALLLLSTLELLELTETKPWLSGFTGLGVAAYPAPPYTEDPPHMSNVTYSESVLFPTFLPALSLPSSMRRGRDALCFLPLAICTSPTPQDPHQTPPPPSPLLGNFPGLPSP